MSFKLIQIYLKSNSNLFLQLQCILLYLNLINIFQVYSFNEWTIYLLKGKGKVFDGQETPSGETTTTECGGQLWTTCANLLKQPNGELLVAVNHNQLRTMASETVDPIDWSHSPPSLAVPPERLVHSMNQCNLGGNRTCNRSMRGNHLAYAATQGINSCQHSKMLRLNLSLYKFSIIIYL